MEGGVNIEKESLGLVIDMSWHDRKFVVNHIRGNEENDRTISTIHEVGTGRSGLYEIESTEYDDHKELDSDISPRSQNKSGGSTPRPSIIGKELIPIIKKDSRFVLYAATANRAPTTLNDLNQTTKGTFEMKHRLVVFNGIYMINNISDYGFISFTRLKNEMESHKADLSSHTFFDIYSNCTIQSGACTIDLNHTFESETSRLACCVFEAVALCRLEEEYCLCIILNTISTETYRFDMKKGRNARIETRPLYNFLLSVACKVVDLGDGDNPGYWCIVLPIINDTIEPTLAYVDLEVVVEFNEDLLNPKHREFIVTVRNLLLRNLRLFRINEISKHPIDQRKQMLPIRVCIRRHEVSSSGFVCFTNVDCWTCCITLLLMGGQAKHSLSVHQQQQLRQRSSHIEFYLFKKTEKAQQPVVENKTTKVAVTQAMTAPDVKAKKKPDKETTSAKKRPNAGSTTAKPFKKRRVTSSALSVKQATENKVVVAMKAKKKKSPKSTQAKRALPKVKYPIATKKKVEIKMEKKVEKDKPVCNRRPKTKSPPRVKAKPLGAALQRIEVNDELDGFKYVGRVIKHTPMDQDPIEKPGRLWRHAIVKYWEPNCRAFFIQHLKPEYLNTDDVKKPTNMVKRLLAADDADYFDSDVLWIAATSSFILLLSQEEIYRRAPLRGNIYKPAFGDYKENACLATTESIATCQFCNKHIRSFDGECADIADCDEELTVQHFVQLVIAHGNQPNSLFFNPLHVAVSAIRELEQTVTARQFKALFQENLDIVTLVLEDFDPGSLSIYPKHSIVLCLKLIIWIRQKCRIKCRITRNTLIPVLYWGLRCISCGRCYHAKCLPYVHMRKASGDTSAEGTRERFLKHKRTYKSYKFQSGRLMEELDELDEDIDETCEPTHENLTNQCMQKLLPKDAQNHGNRLNNVPLPMYDSNEAFGNWKCEFCISCMYCDKPIGPVHKYIRNVSLGDAKSNSLYTQCYDEKLDRLQRNCLEIEKVESVCCVSCNMGAHRSCCNPKVPNLVFIESWRCDWCARCVSCGYADTTRSEYTNWGLFFLFCLRCWSSFEKGYYCGVCYKIWTNYDSVQQKWVQCDGCSLWVHVECDDVARELSECNAARFHNYRCKTCRSSQLMARCWRVLEQLYLMDRLNQFRYPVSASCVVYWRLVTKPMDLTTLRRKLETAAYKTIKEFIADIFLISSNAQLVNMPNTKIYRLSVNFERKCRDVVGAIMQLQSDELNAIVEANNVAIDKATTAADIIDPTSIQSLKSTLPFTLSIDAAENASGSTSDSANTPVTNRLSIDLDVMQHDMDAVNDDSAADCAHAYESLYDESIVNDDNFVNEKDEVCSLVEFDDMYQSGDFKKEKKNTCDSDGDDDSDYYSSDDDSIDGALLREIDRPAVTHFNILDFVSESTLVDTAAEDLIYKPTVACGMNFATCSVWPIPSGDLFPFSINCAYSEKENLVDVIVQGRMILYEGEYTHSSAELNISTHTTGGNVYTCNLDYADKLVNLNFVDICCICGSDAHSHTLINCSQCFELVHYTCAGFVVMPSRFVCASCLPCYSCNYKIASNHPYDVANVQDVYMANALGWLPSTITNDLMELMQFKSNLLDYVFAMVLPFDSDGVKWPIYSTQCAGCSHHGHMRCIWAKTKELALQQRGKLQMQRLRNGPDHIHGPEKLENFHVSTNTVVNTISRPQKRVNPSETQAQTMPKQHCHSAWCDRGLSTIQNPVNSTTSTCIPCYPFPNRRRFASKNEHYNNISTNYPNENKRGYDVNESVGGYNNEMHRCVTSESSMGTLGNGGNNFYRDSSYYLPNMSKPCTARQHESSKYPNQMSTLNGYILPGKIMTKKTALQQLVRYKVTPQLIQTFLKGLRTHIKRAEEYAIGSAKLHASTNGQIEPVTSLRGECDMEDEYIKSAAARLAKCNELLQRINALRPPPSDGIHGTSSYRHCGCVHTAGRTAQCRSESDDFSRRNGYEWEHMNGIFTCSITCSDFVANQMVKIVPHHLLYVSCTCGETRLLESTLATECRREEYIPTFENEGNTKCFMECISCGRRVPVNSSKYPRDGPQLFCQQPYNEMCTICRFWRRYFPDGMLLRDYDNPKPHIFNEHVALQGMIKYVSLTRNWTLLSENLIKYVLSVLVCFMPYEANDYSPEVMHDIILKFIKSSDFNSLLGYVVAGMSNSPFSPVLFSFWANTLSDTQWSVCSDCSDNESDYEDLGSCVDNFGMKQIMLQRHIIIKRHTDDVARHCRYYWMYRDLLSYKICHDELAARAYDSRSKPFARQMVHLCKMWRRFFPYFIGDDLDCRSTLALQFNGAESTQSCTDPNRVRTTRNPYFRRHLAHYVFPRSQYKFKDFDALQRRTLAEAPNTVATASPAYVLATVSRETEVFLTLFRHLSKYISENQMQRWPAVHVDLSCKIDEMFDEPHGSCLWNLDSLLDRLKEYLSKGNEDKRPKGEVRNMALKHIGRSLLVENASTRAIVGDAVVGVPSSACGHCAYSITNYEELIISEKNIQDRLVYYNAEPSNMAKNRKCCLCRIAEHTLLRGSLVPWRSGYIHTQCLLWSLDSKYIPRTCNVNYTSLYDGVFSKDANTHLLHLRLLPVVYVSDALVEAVVSSASKCKWCGKGGASIKCSGENCLHTFHLVCAFIATTLRGKPGTSHTIGCLPLSMCFTRRMIWCKHCWKHVLRKIPTVILAEYAQMRTFLALEGLASNACLIMSRQSEQSLRIMPKFLMYADLENYLKNKDDAYKRIKTAFDKSMATHPQLDEMNQFIDSILQPCFKGTAQGYYLYGYNGFSYYFNDTEECSGNGEVKDECVYGRCRGFYRVGSIAILTMGNGMVMGKNKRFYPVGYMALRRFEGREYGRRANYACTIVLRGGYPWFIIDLVSVTPAKRLVQGPDLRTVFDKFLHEIHFKGEYKPTSAEVFFGLTLHVVIQEMRVWFIKHLLRRCIHVARVTNFEGGVYGRRVETGQYVPGKTKLVGSVRYITPYDHKLNSIKDVVETKFDYDAAEVGEEDIPSALDVRGMRSKSKQQNDNNNMAMQYRILLQVPPERRLDVHYSKIHGLGLFATEDIAAGEPVIEYIGELIRDVIGDMREYRYSREQGGDGSCYMFRLDDQLIVDATRRGTMSRFINHSCDPNCICRIITCEFGLKHIVIFAKTRVKAGDEITYDYQFGVESENQKLTCLCGASNCLGRMN